MKLIRLSGVLAILLVTSCSPSPALPISTQTPVPSITPDPSIAKQLNASLPIPPTTIPADYTVCESGCDYQSIQSAIDNVPAGSIIELTDPVHTEAGILVSKDLTIRGRGKDLSIVQAHETLEESPERVFYIPEGYTVRIENITVRHGKPSEVTEHGGGIMNFGTLTIKDCLITKNSARGGGGVDSRGTKLIILSSTITENVARGDGPRGEACGGGGGVKCSGGELVIDSSTIINNQAGIGAEGLGGGLRTGCTCKAEITNSTISNNKAIYYGGGVAAGGEIIIQNVTINNNSVKHQGGGIWIRGKAWIYNSIIANNGNGMDCMIGNRGSSTEEGKIAANQNNLIEDGSCSPDFSGSPLLAPLSDYGGSTLTQALLPGSPAIDAIPTDDCKVDRDQRGGLRPAGKACDIGAFESQPE